MAKATNTKKEETKAAASTKAEEEAIADAYESKMADTSGYVIAQEFHDINDFSIIHRVNQPIGEISVNRFTELKEAGLIKKEEPEESDQ